MTGVALMNPKFPHNVGGALRACSIWGAEHLHWTGDRVPAPEDWPEGARLPREERMKLYERVKFTHTISGTGLSGIFKGFTPVCVELRDEAENLVDFVHPENAVYIFGPEDGNVPKGMMHACHRFVRIPSDSCLNLAAAINVVLYDRHAKEWRNV